MACKVGLVLYVRELRTMSKGQAWAVGARSEPNTELTHDDEKRTMDRTRHPRLQQTSSQAPLPTFEVVGSQASPRQRDAEPPTQEPKSPSQELQLTGTTSNVDAGSTKNPFSRCHTTGSFFTSSS